MKEREQHKKKTQLSHVNWQMAVCSFIHNVIECSRLRNQSVRLHASLATEHQCDDGTMNEKDSHVCHENSLPTEKISFSTFVIAAATVVVVVAIVSVCVYIYKCVYMRYRLC